MKVLFLTVWDLLVRVQIFVYIHGEIHHVSVAEEVQLPLEKFLLIVDLPKPHIYIITRRGSSNYIKRALNDHKDYHNRYMHGPIQPTLILNNS